MSTTRPAFVVPEDVPAFPRFAGKTAIVTGGGVSTPTIDADFIGTGAATCILLARQGCRVTIFNRHLESAQQTLKVIEEAGGEGIAIEGNVANEADCQRAVDATVAAFGSVDFLVNNVGQISYAQVPVADVDLDEWDRLMDVNVKGMVLMARHALQHMPDGGAIVNISSISAFRPHVGNGPYTPSKAAVNGLTIQMAVDYAHRNIRANAIEPGPVWTPIGASNMRQERALTPEEIRAEQLQKTLLPISGSGWDIAAAVAFLCSDESRWITAHILTVDAGATVRRFK